MKKEHVKQAVEFVAFENKCKPIDIITKAQSAAAAKGDEKSLALLIEIKREYIQCS